MIISFLSCPAEVKFTRKRGPYLEETVTDFPPFLEMPEVPQADIKAYKLMSGIVTSN